MFFKNRQDAGRKLASELKEYKDRKDVQVLGLARGGVIVAYEVAKALELPLNIVIPRKIGAPGNPELAIGAITETGAGVLNENIIARLGVSQAYIEQAIHKEKEEAQRRIKLYRKYAPLVNLEEKTVILVDDGIATGATMQAAVKSVQAENASYVIVAVPVASRDAIEILERMADKIVSLYSPADFGAVGYFYEYFDQAEDSEILDLLCKTRIR